MASQHYPTNNNNNNHHHLQPHQPSTSTSPHENSSSSLPSSSSSSLSSSATIPTSPPVARINASHFSKLFNNNFHELLQDISCHGEGFGLSHLLHYDNSNMLHLAASTSQLGFINSIFGQSLHLLRHQNSNHDLPIHVAAKSCRFDTVERLVLFDTAMLEMVNRENNTALHIALENHQKEMAEVLFRNCPKTFCFVNYQGFSPLYLAIKAEFWDLAKEMLSYTEYDEAEDKLLERLEGRSRSVVHAAIIAKRKDILEMMIDKYERLLYETTDEMGRRPLSYAAYTGFLDGVNYLLINFPNEPYKIDEDENCSFPIHSACKGGDIKVVNAFFSKLPKESMLLRNKKGQNILHVAADSGKSKIVEFILGHPELEMMINMKDEDGNTPLHLAAKGKHARVVYVLTWDKRVKLGVQNKKGCTALDIAEDYEDQIPSFEERLTWLSLRYAGVPRAPKLHYLNVDIIHPGMASSVPNNQTPTMDIHTPQYNPINMQFGEDRTYTVLPRNGRNLDTTSINNPNNAPTTFLDQQELLNLIKDHPKRKRKNKYKERINALLVVATLVATVTFASGFTVPGGYNNNDPNIGLATLAHEVFFQVFVISNTIAMYSAILSLVTLIWAHLDDPRLVLVSLDFALPLLGVALAMMSVAFTAALYVVLHNMVFWLGVVVLIMGGVFLVAFLVFFLPLYSPTSRIRNKILRCVSHIPFKLMLLACEKGKSR